MTKEKKEKDKENVKRKETEKKVIVDSFNIKDWRVPNEIRTDKKR